MCDLLHSEDVVFSSRLLIDKYTWYTAVVLKFVYRLSTEGKATYSS